MWKRLQRGFVALLVTGALSVVATSMAQAKVLRVIVEHRSDVLGGRSFGDAGPYEKLVGRVLFVFDPANPYNARIVDPENAPRNADGMVEAWANFVVLRPKNQPPGGRTALLEVSNRGGKLALYLLSAGSMSLDPTTAEDYGDGLVFRLGLTVMWVGWQHDIPERDDALRIHIPTATAQHWMWPFPPPPEAKIKGTPIYRGNPVDYAPNARALLVRMMDWVRDGTAPPPSEYPRIGERTLVPIQRVDFPAIRGVAFPKVIHQAYRADYGPRWVDGVVDHQPPKLGKPFAAMVSQVDSLGNEVAGLCPIEVLAPLATYAPWNLRIGYPGGTDELTRILGSYIPLPRTASERRASGDPRPSIEELYGDKTRYLRVAREAARSLVQAGFLLEEDIDRVTARASAHWDWLHAN